VNLEFYPVNLDRWADYEALFESKGAPHYCWCMAWRKADRNGGAMTKAQKKTAMKQRISEGTPVGILAFMDQEPVAWCSIAPRESYRNLGGDETIENVWSLACFFIKRPYRKQGLSRQLLDHAVQYAADNGARYIEAYPVEKGSPSYQFMGYQTTFSNAGFRLTGRAGKRRSVMLLDLKDHPQRGTGRIIRDRSNGGP
jgi:GNAT superfamily N-acetyltransferase